MWSHFSLLYCMSDILDQAKQNLREIVFYSSQNLSILENPWLTKYN